MSDRGEKYKAFGKIDYPQNDKRLEWINTVERLPTEQERAEYTIMWQGEIPIELADAYGTKWCKIHKG